MAKVNRNVHISLKKSKLFFSAPPKQGPKIIGQISNAIGDSINLTCSSIGSKPAAQLTWHLNEQPINKNKLGHYAVIPTEHNLETSTLELNFVIE